MSAIFRILADRSGQEQKRSVCWALDDDDRRRTAANHTTNRGFSVA
jgi:hypothetical protein